MDKMNYINKILDSISDFDRMKLVIETCENHEVKIIDNKIIINNKDPSCANHKFKKAWDETWEELRQKGQNIKTERK